jgi:hypothetical protein
MYDGRGKMEEVRGKREEVRSNIPFSPPEKLWFMVS